MILTALLVCALAACARADRHLLDATPTPQTSIPWSPLYLDPTAPLPINSPQFARNVTGLDPEQVHITYVSYSEVVISWATGVGIQSAEPLQGFAGADIDSEVYYGTSSLDYNQNATGYSLTYQQIYTQLNGSWPLLNYSSPLLHHVPLTGLQPATKYFYVVGDAMLGLSEEFSFTTAPSQEDPYPLRLGIIADLGETVNSTQTIEHLLANNPQFVTIIGDLTYADDISVNGTETTSNGTATEYPSPSPSGTYQPRWDAWFRWLQPLFSSTPALLTHGNHELEPQGNAKYAAGLDASPAYPGGRQFQSYVSRSPVPHVQSGSDSPLWYSVNLGPIHLVMLSNYDDFSEGSPQYEWLVQDLASFDRAATPWLFATWHAPWYSSYTTHYMENQCMRESMETLLYDAGVDMVLNGHLHTYERSYPVYNYTRDPCGPVHLVIGDGGNIEGLYKTFAEEGTPTCPTPGKIPAYQPGGYCPEASFPYNGNYCPTGQPEWSAFRQPAFGHAVMDFINSTHAYYAFNRNIDAQNVVADEFYLVRDLSCPNKASYPSTASTASAGK